MLSCGGRGDAKWDGPRWVLGDLRRYHLGWGQVTCPLVIRFSPTAASVVRRCRKSHQVVKLFVFLMFKLTVIFFLCNYPILFFCSTFLICIFSRRLNGVAVGSWFCDVLPEWRCAFQSVSVKEMHSHRRADFCRGSCRPSLRSSEEFWCCRPGQWRRTAKRASPCPESPGSRDEQVNKMNTIPTSRNVQNSRVLKQTKQNKNYSIVCYWSLFFFSCNCFHQKKNKQDTHKEKMSVKSSVYQVVIYNLGRPFYIVTTN